MLTLSNLVQQNNWIVVDGEFLTDSPEYLFTCGKFHVDSVLIMMAQDEAWPLDMSGIFIIEIFKYLYVNSSELSGNFVTTPDAHFVYKRLISGTRNKTN